MLPELIAYHPSLAYLIDQQYTKSVDEILAVRKPLPFVDEEEMKRQMKEEMNEELQKQSNTLYIIGGIKAFTSYRIVKQLREDLENNLAS